MSIQSAFRKCCHFLGMEYIFLGWVIKMKKITRVVFYIRVSKDEQALHGFSLQAQVMKLTEYAEKKGYKVQIFDNKESAFIRGYWAKSSDLIYFMLLSTV